jgi:hypothetical protein
LAVKYAGVRAVEIIAESLEMVARVLARWVREGDWALPDAARVMGMIGAGTAERVYGLR